jgi:hypothetical protein
MLQEFQFLAKLDEIGARSVAGRMFFHNLIIKQHFSHLLYWKELCTHQCQEKYANNLFGHPYKNKAVIADFVNILFKKMLKPISL